MFLNDQREPFWILGKKWHSIKSRLASTVLPAFVLTPLLSGEIRLRGEATSLAFKLKKKRKRLLSACNLTMQKQTFGIG